MRILLFLATNAAILVVLSITMRLLGVEGALDANGVDLNISGLLVISAVVGFTGSFISLAISKWMAKRSTGAKVIETPSNDTERWLIEVVTRQAQQADIGMPEVAIYQSDTPNAFATGMSKNNALVAVSTGLMQSMTKDEVEAVLAHEVSHVANGDMITMTLIQGVVNTFVFFLSRVIGHIVDRVILKNNRGHGIGYFVTSMIAQVVLSILASTIVMWFSRKREFRADAGAAKLVGPSKMIAALQRLDSGNTEALPEQMQAMGIAGSKKSRFGELFATHPSLDDRITALRSLG
ncbi:MAG: protease HtpX [Methylophaga sp.]|nr:protease HtpX [Methylophaga sp.]